MVGYFLYLFLLLTGVGCLFALPVLIPPVRRWLRVDMERRVSGIISLSWGTLIFTFITLSYMGAQIEALFLCYPLDYTCNAEDVARFDFTSQEKLKTAVAQELFRRNITPPPFRQDCYSDDAAFCEFVRPSSSDGEDVLGLLMFLLIVLYPAIVTGLLVWWGTRPPKKRRADSL